MTEISSIYREARQRIWPILKHEIHRDEDVIEAMKSLSEQLRETISLFLQWRSLDLPAPFLQHLSAWAGLFQESRELIEAAEDLGLFAPIHEPEEPSIAFALLGMAAEAAGIAGLGREFMRMSGMTEVKKREQARIDDEIKAHRKEGTRLEKNRVKLERQLRSIGKKYVPKFRAADYVWLRKRSGNGPEASSYHSMGLSNGAIAEVLRSLPGGERLSSIELLHEAGLPFIIAGAESEGFQLVRTSLEGTGILSTERGALTRDEVMAFVSRFLEEEPGWFAGAEWKVVRGE